MIAFGDKKTEPLIKGDRKIVSMSPKHSRAEITHPSTSKEIDKLNFQYIEVQGFREL